MSERPKATADATLARIMELHKMPPPEDEMRKELRRLLSALWSAGWSEGYDERMYSE